LTKLNNLQQRLIVGIIGSIIMMYLIQLHEIAYFALFLVIGLSTQLEFYKLLGLDGMFPLKTFGTLMGGLLFSLTFFVQMGWTDSEAYYILFALFSLSFIIKLYKKELFPFVNVALTYLGVIYVMIPFSLLTVAAFDNGEYNYEIIISSLLLLWASDTGAYFSGKYFGRRKLFRRISPKKTWEGTVGGALLTFVFAYGLSNLFETLTAQELYMVAVVIIIFGSYGDLVESLFKRSIDIKDSGTVLPGHGGFLDRFDGLLLASPFILLIFKFF
jgi:phosphatidate cytidylyltransferase